MLFRDIVFLALLYFQAARSQTEHQRKSVYCGDIEELPEMKVRGGHSVDCFIRKPITFEVCRLLLIESPVCTALTYKNGMCRLHDRRRATVTNESASMRQQAKMITIYKYEEGFDNCLDDARFTYDTAENHFEKCMIRLSAGSNESYSPGFAYAPRNKESGDGAEALLDPSSAGAGSSSDSRSPGGLPPFLGIVMAVNALHLEDDRAQDLERIYANYRCYCAIHRCVFEVNAVHTNRHEEFLLERHGLMLRRFLWRYQWVLVVSPHSLVLNMSFSLAQYLHGMQQHFIFHTKSDGLIDTDHYFVRNSPFSRCFIRMWSRMKASQTVNAMARDSTLFSVSSSSSSLNMRMRVKSPQQQQQPEQTSKGAQPQQAAGIRGTARVGKRPSRAQFMLNATLHRLQTSNNGKGVNLRRISSSDGTGGGRHVPMLRQGRQLAEAAASQPQHYPYDLQGSRQDAEIQGEASPRGTAANKEEEGGGGGGPVAAAAANSSSTSSRPRSSRVFLQTVRWMPSHGNDAGDLMVAIMLLVNRQTVLACYGLTQAKHSVMNTTAATMLSSLNRTMVDSGGDQGASAGGPEVPGPSSRGGPAADTSNSYSNHSIRGIIDSSTSSGAGFMKCAKVFRDPLLNLNRFRGPAALIKINSPREGVVQSIDATYSDSTFMCSDSDVIGYSDRHSMSAIWQLHLDFVAMKAGSGHICGVRRDGEKIEDFLLNSMCMWKYVSPSARCRPDSCFSGLNQCYRTPFCGSVRASRARWTLCSDLHVCDPALRREEVDLALRNESYLIGLQVRLNFTDHLFL